MRPSYDSQQYQTPIRHTSLAAPTEIAIFGHTASYVRRIAGTLACEVDIVIVFNADPISRSDHAHRLPSFDIALIDIDIGPTSTGAQIRILNDLYPDKPIIGVTSCDAIHPICQAIDAGAAGVLHQSDLESGRFDFQNLAVGSTRATLSPRIARLLLDRFRNERSAGPQETQIVPHATTMPDNKAETILSPRECEVLRLSASGLVGREIAGILSVSPHTITTHFKNIYRKLEVNTRGEAVFRAHCAGLI